jgi:hypothetical protein
MGNPALAEFQIKLITQFAETLLGPTAAMMVAEPNVSDEVQVSDPVTFTKGDLRRAVEKVTANWRATYERTLIRDAEGIVQDGIDLVGPVHEPITHLVRLKVSTHLDRAETAEEKADYEERLAALLWKPEKGPPPKRVSGLQLLDQDIWWIPKGNEPIRLVDMADSHRRNLAAFLRRNAAHYKNREWSEMLWLMVGPLGPRGDGAVDAAESCLYGLDREDPLVWLAEKPLLRALIPTVYLWQAPRRVDGWVTCHAVVEDGRVLASSTSKRRRVAMADIQQSKTVAQTYRDAFGGVGPAFYRLVTLAAEEPLPEATRRVYELEGESDQ